MLVALQVLELGCGMTIDHILIFDMPTSFRGQQWSPPTRSLTWLSCSSVAILIVKDGVSVQAVLISSRKTISSCRQGIHYQTFERWRRLFRLAPQVPGRNRVAYRCRERPHTFHRTTMEVIWSPKWYALGLFVVYNALKMLRGKLVIDVFTHELTRLLMVLEAVWLMSVDWKPGSLLRPPEECMTSYGSILLRDITWLSTVFASRRMSLPWR